VPAISRQAKFVHHCWGITIVVGEARLLMVGCVPAVRSSKYICSGYYAFLFTRCMFIYKAGVREHGSVPIGQGRGKAVQVGGWCGGWWEHFTTLREISTPTSALAFPLGRMVCKVSGSIPAFSEWPTPAPNLSCKYSEIFHGPIDRFPVRH
jgi:hypothetical protein